MRKIFNLFVAAAILFGVASCTTDDASAPVVGGESVELTFTANLGELGTRADANLGSGSLVDRVYVGVYESTGSKSHLGNLTLNEGYPVVDGKATVTVVLLKDKVYDLVFWAQNDAVGSNCYIVDWAARNVSVSYRNVESQLEARDAFFLVRNNWKAGADETTFSLSRPFAQLNAGLTPEEVTNVTNNGVDVSLIKSAVTVKSVANLLNLGAENPGSVSGAEDVTFTLAAKPTQTLVTANNVEHAYLSMNYMLVNEYRLVHTAYTFQDGEGTVYSRSYSSVPLERNYRTNIVGSLLSNPIDFNIEIVPVFTNSPEGDHNYDVVSSAADLKNALNSGVANVTLGSDIDLTESLIFSSTGVRSESAVKQYTLDLNSRNVTISTPNDKGYCIAIIVEEGAELTIKGAGSVQALSGGSVDMAVWAKGGTVNIEGGNYYGITNHEGCDLVYASANGVVNVAGGHFEIENPVPAGGGFAAEQYSLLNCSDGKGTITVTGGTFVKFDPANNVSEGKGTNFVADGYVAVKDGDNYTVVPAAATVTDAAGNVSSYLTLGEAFTAVDAAAKAGATITMLHDQTLTTGVKIMNSTVLTGVTLDGNGKTITLDMGGVGTGIRFGGNWATGVTVKNLTIDGSASYALWLNGGTTSTLENLTITGEYDAVYGALILYGTHGATLTNSYVVSGFTNGQDDYPLTLVSSHIGHLVANLSEAADLAKVFVDKNSYIDSVECGGSNSVMIDGDSLSRIGHITTEEGDVVVMVNKVWYAKFDEACAAAGENAPVVISDSELTLTADLAADYTLDMNSATLDGAGKTISIPATVETNVLTDISGTSTVKNLTVKGEPMTFYTDAKGAKKTTRALYFTGVNGNFVVENVDVSGAGYALNVNTTNYNLFVSNSTLRGWLSWGKSTNTIMFNKVHFGIGTFYDETYDAIYNGSMRPYANTVLNNCTFDKGFNILTEGLAETGSKVTLKNCTVEGVVVTASNIDELLSYDLAKLDYIVFE